MKLLKTAVAIFLSGILLYACQKEYSIENGGLKLAVGNWEFADSAHTYMGNMDTAYIVAANATKELHLEGVSGDGSQNFRMILYADSFKTGSYKASLFQSSFQYTATAKTIYQADQLTGEFIVTITSLSNDLIVGTFSGIAKDSANKLVQLTQGKFKSTFGSASDTQPSSGVLGDSAGNCKPVVVHGIYSPGIAVTSENTVEAQVTVAVAGAYSISTNSINGVTFSAAGTFASVGAQSVTLTASGTPVAAGSQSFTMNYGNSACTFKVDFMPAASGTLGGGGGTCTPFTFAGNYQQGIALNATNTLQIQVNVTTLGGYKISSNTVNGVSFSQSGKFTVAGVQAITLAGNGTPADAGAQNFAITFGPSTCNFSLTFLAGASPSNDYFPLTVNSNWTQGEDGTNDSTYKKVISYSPTLGGNTYTTITKSSDASATAQVFDSSYYRKSGNDYYQYINYKSLNFEGATDGDIIILKDNVPEGNTWNSPTINGTLSGMPVSFYTKMTILAKAVPVTLGSFNYPDVIKVKYEVFLASAPATSLQTIERWFARNVGEIYTSVSDGVTTTKFVVGDYHIY